MVEIFNLHKFLFSINYEGSIEGYSVLFIDRNNEKKEIKLSKIEISSSHVSCKLFDEKDKMYIVPFLRIEKVFENGELAFDNSDVDRSNVKIIKGFK